MSPRRSRAKADPAPGADPGVGSRDPEEGLPFEDALGRLEEIVEQLEQGDLDLEAALGAFEEGVRLSAQCAAQLDVAERRIEVLIREGGQWVTRPFEEAPAEGGSPAKRQGGSPAEDED